MKRLLSVIALLLCGSCATIDSVAYFQNQKIDTKFEYVRGGYIRFGAGDEISIYVTSKNPELAAIFNLTEQLKGISINSSVSTPGYTIDSNGDIDFPILGRLHVEGMTREELSRFIKGRIMEEKLLNDPIVIVDFDNLKFAVLGDVASPGIYTISSDCTTILDAIAMAGDLQITAQRDRVFLTRDMDGEKITYQLDLKSTEIYQSPAYYLQQNDMIYVEPNEVRSNQSTINGNTVRSASFWISLSSLLMTIVVLFVN
ncbi:MAG: polysaccharide biosynthesis/export family protein [Rikenellaceae bacterium]